MSKEPKFHILDIVEAPLIESDGVTLGIVSQVRSYPDGRFRYSVGPLSTDKEYIGGIYDEELLKGTGRREDSERYIKSGPFLIRDVVIIADECSLPEFGGKTGVVRGSSWDDDSDILVWFEDLEEVAVFRVDELIPTGERRSPNATGLRTSSQVSCEGALLTTDSYNVIEDIGDL